MNTGLEYYKDFIDGLVKRKNGVLGKWILENGYPDNEENREYNELLNECIYIEQEYDVEKLKERYQELFGTGEWFH